MYQNWAIQWPKGPKQAGLRNVLKKSLTTNSHYLLNPGTFQNDDKEDNNPAKNDNSMHNKNVLRIA